MVDGTADSSVAIAGDATNGLDVDVTRVQGTVTVADGGGMLSVDDGGGSLTVDGTVGVSGSVAVTGPLTDTQLRATAVPVSGTVTITDGSGPVTVDGSVSVTNFPATQSVSGTIGIDSTTNTVKIDSTTNTVRLDASQVTTLTPPAAITGFATSALQSTGNTSLGNIDTKLPAQGQALAASSLPVVLPAAQITALTPPTSVGITGTPTVSLTGTNTVTQTPATSGGLLSKRQVTASASNNGVSIKSSAAGQLYGIVAGNYAASARFIHLYDASSLPAIGTTPALTFLIPANTSGAGIVMSFDSGIAFTSGIHAYITGSIDGSSSNTTAADCVVNFLYK